MSASEALSGHATDVSPLLATTPAKPVPKYPWGQMRRLMTTAVFQSYALSAAQSVLAYLLSEGLAPSYSFDDDDATVLVNMFMFVYFGFGVAGGWFADHIGGNYPTEIACSVVWALGSIVMCFAVAPGLMSGLDGSDAAAPTLTFLFVGLALVAVGYGVVNPLQSVLVADQFSEGGEEDLVRSFSAYYLWCNVGNILGEFGGPVLRYYVSYSAALISIAVAQVIGTVALWSGGRLYRRVPPRVVRESARRGMVGAVAEVLPPWYSRAFAALYGVRRCLMMFALLPIFWALLFQQSSTWVFQGADMNNVVAGPVSIPPDMMPSLEDFMVVLCIVLLDYVVYPIVRRRTGRPVTSLSKMTAGMFCMAIGFFVTGFLQLKIDAAPPNSVWIGWQAPQYFFIAAGEVLVSVPGLEFAYSQAPANMKGLVTGIWGMTQALGNGIVATVAGIDVLSDARSDVFFGYAGAMTAAAVAFMAMGRGFAYVDTAAASTDLIVGNTPGADGIDIDSDKL